jgi:hypothetical protein
MTSQASTQPHLALNTTQHLRAHLSRVVDDGIHKHTHSLTKSSTTPMTFHPSPRRPSHHIIPPRVITIQNLGTNLKPIERKSVDRFFPHTAYLPSTFRIRPPPTIPSETPHTFHSKTSGTHTLPTTPPKTIRKRWNNRATAQRATHTPPVPAYPFPVHLRPVRQLGPISRPRRTYLA